MHDPRIDQVAHVLVNYSIAVRPGELILIQGTSAARPLLKALVRQVLQAGGFPEIIADLPGLEEIRLQEASEAQLAYVPSYILPLVEQIAGFISVKAEVNTRALTNVDPAKRVTASRAMVPIMEAFQARVSEGKLRAVTTLFPTQAYAQDAEMSLEEYEDFVYQACLPDQEDPIGFWRQVSRRQEALVNALQDVHQLHVMAPDTDLRLEVTGRKFINCDGHRNFPDGEVYTGPLETSAQGQVRFNFPSNYRGVQVEDVRLWFEEGRVVKATAAKGERFLHHLLDTDEGARRLGEFAIGTNPGIQRFTGQTLFDEKIHGTMHMALGLSIPQTGGVNKSAIHWDMVRDLREGGAIYADGRLIYHNGDFVPEFVAARDGRQ